PPARPVASRARSAGASVRPSRSRRRYRAIESRPVGRRVRQHVRKRTRPAEGTACNLEVGVWCGERSEPAGSEANPQGMGPPFGFAERGEGSDSLVGRSPVRLCRTGRRAPKGATRKLVEEVRCGERSEPAGSGAPSGFARRGEGREAPRSMAALARQGSVEAREDVGVLRVEAVLLEAVP